MSARSPTRSPAKAPKLVSEQDSDGGESEGGGAAGTAADDGECMIGRKILKRQGDTVVNGHVKDYNPPSAGREATWTLRYETLSGDDEDSEADEEVNRAELDKRLNLQAVKEREFPMVPAKRGRGRPRKLAVSDDSSSSSSGASSGASSSSGGVKKKKKKKRAKTKSTVPTSPKPASNGVAGKKRSFPSPGSEADIPLKKKKKKKKKADGGDSTKLRGNGADLGKRVAREFAEGVFTGEVVEVKPKGPRGILWKIEYEDADGEDLNEEEMKRFAQTYKLLADSFAATKGKTITAEDLAAEDLEEEEDIVAALSRSSSSQGTPKGKNKGRSNAAQQERLVGVGVRKYFESYDHFFDGKVSRFFPAEDDDDYGDLWLIKYEDGDAEHMDLDELKEASALYNKTYALVKKRVAFPTNTLKGGIPATNLSQKVAKITLFGETPLGSRGIFSTIAGYRRYKSKHQGS